MGRGILFKCLLAFTPPSRFFFSIAPGRLDRGRLDGNRSTYKGSHVQGKRALVLIAMACAAVGFSSVLGGTYLSGDRSLADLVVSIAGGGSARHAGDRDEAADSGRESALDVNHESDEEQGDAGDSTAGDDASTDSDTDRDSDVEESASANDAGDDDGGSDEGSGEENSSQEGSGEEGDSGGQAGDDADAGQDDSASASEDGAQDE
jgi:hypothetical protein